MTKLDKGSAGEKVDWAGARNDRPSGVKRALILGRSPLKHRPPLKSSLGLRDFPACPRES
jgi:hypothetical protein